MNRNAMLGKNLSSLIQVDRLVTLSDGTERHEKQYYLSSLPAEAVEKISSYIIFVVIGE